MRRDLNFPCIIRTRFKGSCKNPGQLIDRMALKNRRENQKVQVRVRVKGRVRVRVRVGNTARNRIRAEVEPELCL